MATAKSLFIPAILTARKQRMQIALEFFQAPVKRSDMRGGLRAKDMDLFNGDSVEETINAIDALGYLREGLATEISLSPIGKDFLDKGGFQGKADRIKLKLEKAEEDRESTMAVNESVLSTNKWQRANIFLGLLFIGATVFTGIMSYRLSNQEHELHNQEHKLQQPQPLEKAINRLFQINDSLYRELDALKKRELPKKKP